MGDKLGDLVDKLEKTKIVNGDEESNHVGAPGRYIKHPLQNAWTLWFFKNDKSRTWEENQRPIFTEGIFPDWEDPRNQDGGRWIISLDKKFKQELLDTYWLEIIFFLIGEHADQHAHQVNGAVVNVRMRTDKLAVWLADASHDESIMRIGRMLKERLGMDSTNPIGFSVHNEEKSQMRPGQSKQRFQV